MMGMEPINIVKETRLALGLTQEKMARELGCSYASARRFESTGALPRVEAVRERLEKLAKKAGVAIEADTPQSTL
jgi:transcriptional regulator with XRE-family HTH domain